MGDQTSARLSAGAALDRFGLPARAPFGERRAPRRLLEDPLRVGGVRPYELGDEPRRIHWKATARTGELQSKVYEPSAHHTLVVFVDQRTQANAMLGSDPALVELGISVAASVAAWGLEQGYAVGLYANGLQMPDEEAAPAPVASEGVQDTAALERAIRATPSLRVRIPASTDRGQLVRMLEALARVVSYFPSPMAQILAAEETRLPYGTTVVYIGTAAGLRDDGLAHLRRLRARGHSVALLLVGDEKISASDLSVTQVGNAATWQRLLDDALARRGLDRQGLPLAAARQPAPDMPTGAPNLDLEVPA